MTKAKRNIGREILEGLRAIKRGEYRRVVNAPDVFVQKKKELKFSPTVRRRNRIERKYPDS